MTTPTLNLTPIAPQLQAQGSVPAVAVRPASPAERPIHLTPRELEVLALLCEGLPNKLISRRLQISSATVKCHISGILSELGVSSRLQAVVAAARHGLLPEQTTAEARGGDAAVQPHAGSGLDARVGFARIAAAA